MYIPSFHKHYSNEKPFRASLREKKSIKIMRYVRKIIEKEHIEAECCSDSIYIKNSDVSRDWRPSIEIFKMSRDVVSENSLCVSYCLFTRIGAHLSYVYILPRCILSAVVSKHVLHWRIGRNHKTSLVVGLCAKNAWISELSGFVTKSSCN